MRLPAEVFCVVVLTSCANSSQAPRAKDAAPTVDAATSSGAAGAGGSAPPSDAAAGMAGSGSTADGPVGTAGAPPTSDGGSMADVNAPTNAGVHIVFPPASAVAADTIVVRGTSTFAAPVGTILVNGKAATSGDGFATFRAVVPLALGDNAITVIAQSGGGGALGQAQVTVRRFADDASIARGGGDPFSLFRLFGFTVDATQTEAIVADDIFDGLVRIDLRTGNRALASASESSAKGMVGKGYDDIAQPRDVTLDGPGHALIPDADKIIGIDLASGDRTLLSGAGTGAGPSAVQLTSLGFDEVGHLVIALDYQGNALFAIDPASGARAVLSSATVGVGPAFDSYGAIEVDVAHHRALTTRAYQNPIIAIDLASGDRSVLSGDKAGTGPALVEPTALAVAPSLGVVFAWDGMAKHLVAVDLATGNRRVVADATTGGGVALPALETLAFGPELLFALGDGVLLAIDPVEGHRVVVSK